MHFPPLESFPFSIYPLRRKSRAVKMERKKEKEGEKGDKRKKRRERKKGENDKPAIIKDIYKYVERV